MKETWLVTGSSVGLGRSIVEAALAEGHNVVATARHPRTLDDLASQFPDQLLAQQAGRAFTRARQRSRARPGRAKKSNRGTP
jgi:NAD(P)-dependent dehydrogenase (short-subunit alcohol dehydrogenase family)